VVAAVEVAGGNAVLVAGAGIAHWRMAVDGGGGRRQEKNGG